MIGAPPLELGAVQESDACLLPEVADRLFGAPGIVAAAAGSITIFLLAPSEFAAPGDASVSVAAFCAASLMVPPFGSSESVST